MFLSDFADAFANAPFQPDGWDSALKLMARGTGSARGQLLAVHGSNAIPLNWITDADPFAIADLPAVGGADPKRSWRVASAGLPMQIISERHYAQARRRVDSEAYDELCDRLDMVHGAQTVLRRDGPIMYGLATLRSRSDGVSTADQLSLFGQIAPLARMAVQLQNSIANDGAKLLLGALEEMKAAAFICDQQARIFAFTRPAEDVLSSGELILRRGELHASDTSFAERLHRGLSKVLDDATPVSGSDSLWLPLSEAPGDGYWLDLFPLPRKEWSFSSEPRAIIVVRSPHAITSDWRYSLQSSMRLTRAEAEIAIAIANGKRREQIAIERGSSVRTVDTQLKSIFEKADVSREVELAVLLNKLLRS